LIILILARTSLSGVQSPAHRVRRWPGLQRARLRPEPTAVESRMGL